MLSHAGPDACNFAPGSHAQPLARQSSIDRLDAEEVVARPPLTIHRVSGPERSVRASDDDRERVAQELGRQAGAGRLTAEELDERLEAAYAARTEAELARLTEDLPAPPVAPAPSREVALRRARFQHRAAGALLTILVCVGVWAATGADASFWPIWVVLACGVGVVREGFRAYGPGTEFSDEELGLHERARRRRLG